MTTVLKNQTLFFAFFASFFLLISCQEKGTEIVSNELEEIPLSYAQGFEIQRAADYWVLEVTQPWKGADKSFRYVVLEEHAQLPDGEFDGVVQLPVEDVILTSTTQIPHLDLLGATDRLLAFPNLDLISSEKVWDRIRQNQIEDLGSAPSANIEMVLDLEPEWMMISTLGSDVKNLELLQKAGIAAPINGEYVEQHPLGRAEWIKFTGVLLGKLDAADSIFRAVESAYLEAKALTDQVADSEKPSVLSGVLYQDVWYAPGAESWGAKILENAGGAYIFKENEGSGSLELNYEYVLDQALDTECWIGSADFASIDEMGAAEPRYRAFKAFQTGNVFTYTGKRGPKGGYEYFELGYMRPDWVLKDLIKILHPELLPDYQLYFYTQLDE